MIIGVPRTTREDIQLPARNHIKSRNVSLEILRDDFFWNMCEPVGQLVKHSRLDCPAADRRHYLRGTSRFRRKSRRRTPSNELSILIDCWQAWNVSRVRTRSLQGGPRWLEENEGDQAGSTTSLPAPGGMQRVNTSWCN